MKKLLTVTAPVFLISALVVALGIEVWVRARWDPKNGRPGLFLSDAVRGQRFAANYDGWFSGVPVHINNLGFRDSRDYSIAKRANTVRILFLGDSVTFGHGSLYEHTYPYLLEQRLKAWRPDVDWQVWNLGVPGYNTSQELEHLKEVGPQFAPDLVVVGFFENDLVDNRDPAPPGRLRVAAASLLSFAQRHVYSIELYKKAYLLLRWKLSSSDDYRLRLESISNDERDLRHTGAIADAAQQQLTKFDYVTDEELRTACPSKPPPNRGVVDAAQRQDGYQAWVRAVRGFQQLNREGRYRIVFFLNVPPMPCPDGPETFYDDDGWGLNALFMRILADGAPAVSVHDALLRRRPSQMPGWNGHSFGNTNVVKADTLFTYLRDAVLAKAVPLPRTPASAAAP